MTVKTKAMKIKNIFYISLLLLFVTLQMRCDVINPEEEIPSYLHIESFEIEENTLVEEGSLRSKIVAAQVLVNNVGVGVIPIPGTIPVFATGDAVITLDPMIQENGANDLLSLYPFFTRVTMNANFAIGEETTINPKSTYISNATILRGDFNGSNVFFVEDVDGNPETKVEITQIGGQAGEGGVGKIVLTEENPIFTGATNVNAPYDISEASRIWLEIQYKTDVPMLFGLLDRTDGDTFDYDEYGVAIKTEWNTLYFNLLDLIRSQQIERFQLSLRANYVVGSELEEAQVLLDNIKLVYL